MYHHWQAKQQPWYRHWPAVNHVLSAMLCVKGISCWTASEMYSCGPESRGRASYKDAICRSQTMSNSGQSYQKHCVQPEEASVWSPRWQSESNGLGVPWGFATESLKEALLWCFTSPREEPRQQSVVQSRSWNSHQWWLNKNGFTSSWKIYRQAVVTARTFKM